LLIVEYAAALVKRPPQSHIGNICKTPPDWAIKYCFQKIPQQRHEVKDPAGPLAVSLYILPCRAVRLLMMMMMMALQAVEKDPLVIFMKGTPAVPQCGFSRAVIQIMDIQVSWRERIRTCYARDRQSHRRGNDFLLLLQGVDKQKLQTYNCLEDQELREGIKEFS
jgi:glutaredoxin-related protein